MFSEITKCKKGLIDSFTVDWSQPRVNHNEWRLLYFISFLLLVGFFVLNMFVGVVVENFHKCQEKQEKEEKIRRAEVRTRKMEAKWRRKSFTACRTTWLSWKHG